MVTSSVIELEETDLPQILIVEDEGLIADNLQEVLEFLNYSVPAIASSGEQALRHVAELRPDLVLMDIRIKGDMDGIQAAELIWQQFQIPVIYVTGHSDKSTVQRARLTAPFGYLLKPIKERELYVAIESALQRCERERWVNGVLKSIGDAVMVVDASGALKFLNPVAEAMTGWPLREAIDRPLTEVFTIIDEQTRLPIANPVLTVLQDGIRIKLESNLLLLTRQGATIPIADSIAALNDNKGAITGAVIVFRDMTAQRQAEERNRAIAQAAQLQQRMEELERLNQLKDDFLSTVSHELRTPLANIKMSIKMLEIVLDQQGMFTPESNPSFQALTRYMEILRNQCNQELQLVNDLLDLQRLNVDNYSLELTSISLADWITDVANNFQVRAQERRIQFQLDLEPDLPPLMSDQHSLNRILTELVNNACKYTPPGEHITLSVRSVHPTGVESVGSIVAIAPRIIITVTNTGVEIPPEEQTQIFEPFYRIPKSDRWQQGGTGLGLALVKQLVTCLNGSIRVESGMGQTSFIVEL
ncbi:MAG TPA: ATP-binding protein [Crinalium sp.]|jgi:hypothetical protein